MMWVDLLDETKAESHAKRGDVVVLDGSGRGFQFEKSRHKFSRCYLRN